MPLFVHRPGKGLKIENKHASSASLESSTHDSLGSTIALPWCLAKRDLAHTYRSRLGAEDTGLSVVRSKPFHEQRGNCCIAAGCGGYWIQRREVQAIPRPAGRLLHLRRKAEKNATTDHTRWCMQCRDGVFIIRSRQLYCFQEPWAPPARPKMSKMGKA
jgi:hypothetical protein